MFGCGVILNEVLELFFVCSCVGEFFVVFCQCEVDGGCCQTAGRDVREKSVCV